MAGGCGLDPFGLEYESMVGTCNRGNEFPGSINRGEFLDQPRNY
jgi:hypothetical protein